MKQMLSNLKILDLTHYITGPYCTKLLADYGADVIKIEKPVSGDPARYMGPFPRNAPDPEKSGLFLHLNTNKRSITLDLKNSVGQEIFLKLLKKVDVLVESFSPQVMPKLGLVYETLEKVSPRLVMTSISNFGQTGPYRDYRLSEIVLSAMGHMMCGQGEPDREPVKMAGNMLQYQSGVIAALLTMMAVFSQRIQGVGQQVDVPIFETQLGSIDRRAPSLVGHVYNPSEVSMRVPFGIGAGFPFGNFPCQDGYFSIAGAASYGFWPRVVAMLGMPELLDDPRFCKAEAQSRPENYQAFIEIFLPWCMDRTREEIVTLGQSKRVPVAPIYSAQDLISDRHMKARSYFIEIDHPIAGKIKYPGAPFKAKVPFQIRRPAPLLGQHNEEVYRQLGYGKSDLVKLREAGVI